LSTVPNSCADFAVDAVSKNGNPATSAVITAT
jgi:hypothetical protein